MTGTFKALLATASLIFAGAVQGQTFSEFRVLPSPATAGRPVALNFSARCDYSGDAPTVSVEGSVVMVGATYSGTGTGPNCTAEPPPRTDVSVPLGTFAAGDYTVRFVGLPLGGVGLPIADPPIDIPLRVTGGGAGQAPVAAPVGGWPAFGMLGGLLALFAARRLRSRA